MKSTHSSSSENSMAIWLCCTHTPTRRLCCIKYTEVKVLSVIPSSLLSTIFHIFQCSHMVFPFMNVEVVLEWLSIFFLMLKIMSGTTIRSFLLSGFFFSLKICFSSCFHFLMFLSSVYLLVDFLVCVLFVSLNFNYPHSYGHIWIFLLTIQRCNLKQIISYHKITFLTVKIWPVTHKVYWLTEGVAGKSNVHFPLRMYTTNVT